MADESVVGVVRERYGAFARSGQAGDRPGVRGVAEAFGYTPEELAAIPAEANMGLSCGNPTATAHLRSGEAVVDLGCGGGIDVFLAARKVGPTGKAVGIDMTPEMIDRARANAGRAGITNVEFHLARIDQLPLSDNSVDCILSNCVINLAPDKPAVFREMFRVLKPGGRVAVSDIALKKPLPEEVARDVLAYVGCVAGAELIADYERQLKEAGFEAVQVVDTRKDLGCYAKAENQTGCCGASEASSETLPLAGGSGTDAGGVHGGLTDLLRRYDVNEYAASVQVYAVKGR